LQKNFAAFGAFVDVGSTKDGLVHLSQLSDSYVERVDDFLSIGQVVNVTVLSVDGEKLSLSMKTGEKPKSEDGRAGASRFQLAVLCQLA
jgi:predicted RNA-binding protein with RPS1 domain